MADVDGLPELVRMLRNLPDRVRKRVINTAMRKAGNMVEDRAHEIALSKFHGEGYMAGFIKTKRGKGGRNNVVYRVGVEGGGRPSKHFPYYWRFLEFGTSKMPARPFMRPAGESTIGKQIVTIRAELKKGIDREAKKLAR